MKLIPGLFLIWIAFAGNALSQKASNEMFIADYFHGSISLFTTLLIPSNIIALFGRGSVTTCEYTG